MIEFVLLLSIEDWWQKVYASSHLCEVALLKKERITVLKTPFIKKIVDGTHEGVEIKFEREYLAAWSYVKA